MKLIILEARPLWETRFGPDLVLQKLESPNYYAVQRDVLGFFKRPSPMGDMLWDDLGFRCVRRKEQKWFKHVVSIEDRDMLILQLMFEEIEFVPTLPKVEIFSADFSQYSNAAGSMSWSVSNPIIQGAMIPSMIPGYADSFFALRREAKKRGGPKRIQDWRPENSVYPKKIG